MVLSVAMLVPDTKWYVDSTSVAPGGLERASTYLT